MTPLMYAARDGALEAAQSRWPRAAPSLDVQDPDGSTAMILAIINGHYDVAAMLLEKGANPNLADSAGMAALYATVDMHTLPFMHGRPYPKPSGRLGVEDFVKLLLGHGADVNQALKSPLLRRHNSTGHPEPGRGHDAAAARRRLRRRGVHAAAAREAAPTRRRGRRTGPRC